MSSQGGDYDKRAPGHIRKFSVSARRLGALSSTSWVTIQTVYTQAFGIAVFAIQAPLLGPRAFGLVAIVMVFVSLCESLLGDVAIEALISVREITPEYYATMNAITLSVAGAVGLAMIVFAQPLAAMFRESELVDIFRALAVLPLISTLGAAPNAATKREMQFKPLTIRMIAGVTCGGIAGIALSILGYGAWALVWQALIQRLVSVVVLWMNTDLPFHCKPSAKPGRELAMYAWPLVISRATSWVSSQLPRLILALSLTVTELGLYSLAARLSDILVQLTLVPRYAVARVELRKHVTTPNDLSMAVGKLVRSMSTLCFPLCFCGAALTPTLMHVWLSPKWFGATLPGQWLLVSSAAWVSFYSAGATFLATNQQRSEALIAALQSITLAAVILGFGPRGLIVVTVAMALRPFALIPLVAALIKSKCRVPLRTFLGSQLLPAEAAAASGGLIWILRDRLAALIGEFATLIVLGALGIGVYVLLIGIFAPNSLRQLLGRTAASSR